MGRTLSFRSRLLLSFVAVAALSLGLFAFFSHRAVGQNLQEEARRDALDRLKAVALVLAGPRDPAALAARLRTVGGELGVGLALLSPDGDMLAQTDARLAELGSPAVLTRPEVAAALQGQVGVAVQRGAKDRPDVVCAAMLLPGGNPPAVLHLCSSVTSESEQLQNLFGGLFAGTLLSLAAAVALAALLTRQMAGLIAEMSLIAEGIGRGQYEKRLRSYPGEEFSALAASINQMAENIQAQIRTITVQKEQLVAILDTMKEGVMLLDRKARIRAVNRALAEIFPGIERSQGKTPLEALLEPSLQRACEVMLDAPEAAQAPQTLQIEPKKGLIYDVGIVPLRERHSGLGLVMVFHDISRLKQLERVRRDFVANVSHELRTPLTSIKGYAETLQGDARTDDRAKAFLDIIVKNANHMTKIVGDLLTLSKLEAARLDFEVQEVDAAAALQLAYRECEPLGHSRGVTLENLLPAGELMVLADADRLTQVFRNLLENAFRYSPENQAVTVFHERRSADIIFGVSDRGPGIPKEEHARIFERFYRVEKHRMKSGGSSGLGLAIAKHIVERHGGHIWVESPARGADTGATFSFSLPTPPAMATAQNG